MKRLFHSLTMVLVLSFGGVMSTQAAENYPAELRGEWLSAAQAGNAQAQYAMGKSMCCGNGNVYNESDAMAWFCQAAKQGHRDAQFEMGRQLEAITERRQVRKAGLWNRESYAWYSLAAKQGHRVAELNRRTLQGSFDPRQQSLADQRINEVMATNCRDI